MRFFLNFFKFLKSSFGSEFLKFSKNEKFLGSGGC